jgi:hypothetical protein
MTWSILFSQADKLLLRLAVLLAAYLAAHNRGLHALTAVEVEGLNTLILLTGSIYGVILAFAIFVIWGQFNDVENSIMRECNALHDIQRFSAYLHPDAAHSIRRNLVDYVQHVVKSEWPALGDGRRDKRTEQAFGELLDAVIQSAPENAAASPVYLRLVEISRQAGERRDERLSRSLTRMPQTLLLFVSTIAVVLLAFVFVYPFRHGGAGVASFSLIAFVLLLADVVMRDMDNPMKGMWNVSPHPFADLRS